MWAMAPCLSISFRCTASWAACDYLCGAVWAFISPEGRLLVAVASVLGLLLS